MVFAKEDSNQAMAEQVITISNPNTLNVEQPPETPAPIPSPWWRVADCSVFAAWIAVVVFTLQYHEKWADEAQAWLIARDLDLRTIWFHELRYEGSPGLWHTILWIAQHIFHARYGALGYIGVAGAAAGVAVLIFKAPFPRYIRWPLAFTYFLVYQYAVIARPYTLLPLLAFTAAILFNDTQHPGRMTVVLILLANLSLHGTILAACLGLGYLIEAIKAWSTLDEQTRHRYVICIAAMALTFLFLFIILKPTPDVEEFTLKKLLPKPTDEFGREITPFRKLTAVTSGAFADYFVPSALFVVLAGVWCFLRERLLTFALPVVLLTGLYSMVHGYPHHHGTVFIAAIVGLWIAWPTEREERRFSIAERRALRGMAIFVMLLCAVNVWDAAVVIRREYRFPYSGAPDAANYLRSVGADRQPMFGFLMGVVAVQAEFEQHLFANIPTSYFHLGFPLTGTNLDVDELYRVQPEYIVAYTVEPERMLKEGIPELTSRGYEIVHTSDGYYMYKRAVWQREFYFILRRTAP